MELYLQGKTVIVTAASKGLGRAIAKEFAREGARVYLSSRNAKQLAKAVASIKQETGNDYVDYIVCDMRKAKDIKQLIAKAVEATGTVDVLINTSGGPPAGDFMDLTDADWLQSFQSNVLSFVRTIREVVPYMKRAGGGRIINLASSSIKQSLDQLVLSNTLRPGIAGLSKSLAQELGKDNILTNTVGPGTIETDRIVELNEKRAKIQGTDPNTLAKEAEKNIPMRRYGTPEEFARPVVFLASAANTYITGQSLIIDGGQVKAL